MLLDKNKTLFQLVDELTQKVTKGEIKMDKDTLAKRIKTLRTDDKTGPIVLIKADEGAKYRNMVDIIDEMAICNIARYAIVDISPFEKELLLTAPK
jgi:biopolymer transport protein ExbD